MKFWVWSIVSFMDSSGFIAPKSYLWVTYWAQLVCWRKKVTFHSFFEIQPGDHSTKKDFCLVSLALESSKWSFQSLSDPNSKFLSPLYPLKFLLAISTPSFSLGSSSSHCWFLPFSSFGLGFCWGFWSSLSHLDFVVDDDDVHWKFEFSCYCCSWDRTQYVG